MPCAITITSVVGFPAAGGPSVQVDGTATECTSVLVTIGCPAAPAPTSATANVDPSGNWTAPFTQLSACQCGGPIRVQASCSGNPSCQDVFQGILNCQGECPNVSVSVTQGECTNGLRDVTLTAVITPMGTGVVVTEWDFGDGMSGTAMVGNSNVQTHAYAPGTYTASLTVITPVGCPAVPISFAVAECACPPPGTDLTVTVVGCAGAGNTAVATFVASYPGSTAGCQFRWVFGDGSPVVTTNTPTVTHSYTTAGMVPASVTIECGACPDGDTVTVPVPGCCPAVTGILVSPPQGCAGMGGSASYNFEATTDPPAAPGTYTWNFGDGTAPQTTTTPTVTHSFASPGNTTVQVQYASPDPQCPPPEPTSVTVTVPACTMPPDDSESFSCLGLRWLVVLMFVLSMLSLYIGICVPGAGSGFLIAAGALAVVAGILLAIWLFICPQPCAWALLLTWQIFLGAGVGALYFATCCPILWGIGAVLILLALILLGAWVRECNVTFCEVIRELIVVVVGIMVPVAGWLADLPFLTPCLNTTLIAIVSSLSGAIALSAGVCLASITARSGRLRGARGDCSDC